MIRAFQGFGLFSILLSNIVMLSCSKEDLADQKRGASGEGNAVEKPVELTANADTWNCPEIGELSLLFAKGNHGDLDVTPRELRSSASPYPRNNTEWKWDKAYSLN